MTTTTQRTMTADLSKKIAAALLPINRKIPHINQGGCGAYAAILAKTFIKHGFDAKIIELAPIQLGLWEILNDITPKFFKDNFKHTLHELNDCRVNKKTPNDLALGVHIVTEVDGYCFDSNSVTHNSDNETITLTDKIGRSVDFAIIGELPLNDLYYVSVTNRGNSTWNDLYNADNNSLLEKEIENALKFLE